MAPASMVYSLRNSGKSRYIRCIPCYFCYPLALISNSRNICSLLLCTATLSFLSLPFNLLSFHTLQLCQTPPAIKAALHLHDDLLMFVYWADAARYKTSRVFARRKRGMAMPEDLKWGAKNSSAAEVDWRSSLLLNLVLQTQYKLTVMRSDPWEVDHLLDHASWGSSSSKAVVQRHSTRSRRTVRVTKVVHASPTRTPVNLDQSKVMDEAPTVSYPDICFAVDDFVEVFESLTLEEPTDCYCVVLHADVENSWKRAMDPGGPSTEEINVESEKKEGGEEDLAAAMGRLQVEESRPRVSPAAPAEPVPDFSTGALVFNGYVSSRQLCKALRAQIESPLRALQGITSGKSASKVLMRGPGGIGSADVAVTHIRSGQEVVSPSKTSSFFIPRFFRSAQTVARGVVEVARAASFSGGPAEDVKLQCALMSLAVPVEALAEEILKAI